MPLLLTGTPGTPGGTGMRRPVLVTILTDGTPLGEGRGRLGRSIDWAGEVLGGRGLPGSGWLKPLET